MSETGRLLRSLFEKIAPPLDVRAAMAAAPLAPRRSRGWVVAVAAAVVVLLAGGGWLLFLRGSSPPVDTATPPVVTTTGGTTATSDVDSTSTSFADLLLLGLRPVRVDCTSELPSFPCEALTDDDPDNAWNAQAGGVGAEITFLFSPPVQIAEVIIYNLEDTERFKRNARIKGIEIAIDDLPQSTIAELEDSNEPQRVQLRSLRTSSVTITITSAYPGQTHEGREPFYELALQEIEFWGRVAPDYPGDACLPSDPRTVPDVVGVSEDEALDALTQAGFCPEQVWRETRRSDEVPEGWVIATDPPAESVLVEDEVVRVLVSGPGPTTATTSAANEPVSGAWFESSLPCCGPSGSVRDLLWDGEQFLALARHPGDASVWRSEDGLTWEEVAYLGHFATREGPGSLDHGEAGYLAGGSVGDQATVWYSSDGAEWTQVTLGSGRVRDVAVTTAGLVAVGTSQKLTDEDWQTGEFTGVGMVWSSADGLAWQAEDLGSLPVYSEFSDVHRLEGRTVAVGSSFPTPSPRYRRWLVAVSDPSGSWEVHTPESLTAFQFDATAMIHRYLAAVDSPDQMLWTTADGESWLSSPLGGLAVQAGGVLVPEALAALGEALVIAGGEVFVPSGEIYNRLDPVVWIREPDGSWRWAAGAPALDPPGGIVYLAAASLDRVVLMLDHSDDRLLIWVFRPAG